MAAHPGKTDSGQYIHANGIDIHYVEAGDGEPVIVLNNAMVSTNRIWESLPFAYAGFMEPFAEHFRVIVPDTRGSGRTVHPGGPISYSLMADDVLALIETLHLDRPSVCGFSEGGTLATIVGMRNPESVRAIVNLDGTDAFNPDPQAPSYVMTRHMLGGGPNATQADPEAVAGRFEELRAMFELMKEDHDAAQGRGHWKTVVATTFDRVSQPCDYTADDLRAITAPTLLLIGDRSPFCTIEEGATAYRALQDGELGVLPNTGHEINQAAVAATISFLERRLRTN